MKLAMLLAFASNLDARAANSRAMWLTTISILPAASRVIKIAGEPEFP